jgi:hypothetical protein
LTGAELSGLPACCTQGFNATKGYNVLPYPQEGFWAVTTGSGSNATLYIDYTQDPEGSASINTQSPVMFRSCDVGRCKGGPGYECGPGYTGLQCSECVPNMFNFQASCVNTCESLGNPTAVTIFGIAAVVTVWLVMNFQTQFECLDAGVSFMQIMSTIFSYTSLYSTHSDSYNNIVTIANLINLNVDYVSPSCIMADGVWPLFTGGFYCLVVIPVLPFAICGVLYGIARLWAKYVKRESMFGLHFGFMVNSKELAWQYLLRCFKASVPFPGIVYNNMCQACFNIFSCQQLRNGLTVMAAAPAIVCWESARHQRLVVISVIALIVYVFGVPAFALGTVVWARRKDLLRHPDVLVAFGFFYTWYSKCPHRLSTVRPSCRVTLG